MINAHCKSQPIFWSLETSHCFIFSSFESPLWHLLPIEDCFVYFENLLCSIAPSFGEGNGTPLQYSCLENPMEGGAWWLQSMGSLRVGHDWETSHSLFTFMHWRRKWQPTPVFLPGESQGRGSLVGCPYGVAQSWTRLRWLSSSSSNYLWL